MTLLSKTASVPYLAAGLLTAVTAQANNRHFGYAYETATMAPGDKEIEVLTTARVCRDEYYSRLDHRLEFEAGLTDKLQTAFYLNWSQTTADPGTGELATAYSWGGFSSEWKYKFTDPSADALGFALYGELGYNTDAIEVEVKTLFDKHLPGGFILAANLVGELEFEAEAEELELEEIGAEAILAVAYAVSPKLSLGLELRNHNEMEKEVEDDGEEEFELEASALFLGPTVAYHTKEWWMTFSVLPQLPALKSEEGVLDLHAHERVEARLIFSMHL